MAVSLSSSVPTIRDDRLEQLENADDPIEVALGTFTLVRLEQLENALPGISVIRGKDTSWSSLHT